MKKRIKQLRVSKWVRPCSRPRSRIKKKEKNKTRKWEIRLERPRYNSKKSWQMPMPQKETTSSSALLIIKSQKIRGWTSVERKSTCSFTTSIYSKKRKSSTLVFRNSDNLRRNLLRSWTLSMKRWERSTRSWVLKKMTYFLRSMKIYKFLRQRSR